MSFKVGASVISPATEFTEDSVAHYFNVLLDCVFTITHGKENLEGYASARPDFDLG